MMPEQRAVQVGETVHYFPADATDAEISAALKAIPEANAKDVPQAQTWKSLAVSAAAKSTPLVSHAAQAVADSPTLAKTAGAIARGGTTLAGVAHGLWTGNMNEVLAAPVEGWAAGKGGYWLGKGLQAVAGPTATLLKALAPYVAPLAYAPALQGNLSERVFGGSLDDFQKLSKAEQIDRLKKNLGMPQGTATRIVTNWRLGGK